MEHTLRCNALKCRKDLNDRAIVTTCSHIFCLDCSNRLHLITPPNGQRRICPACDAQLVNPDDAIITVLNPSEDYKTSVLSGLNPNIIMECAGRALSFWAYQTTQEIVYQEYLAKTLADKYAALNSQMDKVIHDANTEISDLRGKLANFQVDQDNLRHKNEELAQSLRDKTRKHMQTQELYDKLKRRAMLNEVQHAASDAIDNTIQASATGHRFADFSRNEDTQQNQAGLFTGSGDQDILVQPPELDMTASHQPAVQARNTDHGVWKAADNTGTIPKSTAAQTPSNHRQRLPLIGMMGTSHNAQPIVFSRTPMINRRNTSFHRSPLTSLNPNTAGVTSFSGYGLSAGVKVSHPSGTPEVMASNTRPTLRSRVAQRPPTSFTGSRGSLFQPSRGSNMFHNSIGFYEA